MHSNAKWYWAAHRFTLSAVAAMTLLVTAPTMAAGTDVAMTPLPGVSAAPPVQQTVSASAPLQIITDGDHALLTNVSGQTLAIRVYTQDLEGTPQALSGRLSQSSCDRPLPADSLSPWQTACLAQAAPRAGEQTVTYWISTSVPAWFTSVTLPAVTPLTLPVPPALTTLSFTPPVVSCAEVIEVRRLDGHVLKVCLDENGLLGRQTATQVLWPAGTYQGFSSHLSVDSKPATVTVNVRAPWWWALGLVILGLLAPAFLKFTADRHRDRRQIDLAVVEEGMNLREPPSRRAGAFTLDIENGSWRTGPLISPLEPYADIRDKWRALGIWRNLLGRAACEPTVPERLAQAMRELRSSLANHTRVSGSSDTPAVLDSLQGIVDGSALGVDPARVPVSRAADVVASLRVALTLAQDLGRLDLDALANENTQNTPGRGLLAVLEHHIYDLAPASARAADLDTYRQNVQTALDAALQETYASTPRTAVVALNRATGSARLPTLPGWPRSLDVARRQANVEIRAFTGPLLLFALAVTSAVAMKTLYTDTPDWGARGLLDYAYALAGGGTGFALAAILEEAFRRLGGSALVPGLLRPAEGAQS